MGTNKTQTVGIGDTVKFRDDGFSPFLRVVYFDAASGKHGVTPVAVRAWPELNWVTADGLIVITSRAAVLASLID